MSSISCISQAQAHPWTVSCDMHSDGPILRILYYYFSEKIEYLYYLYYFIVSLELLSTVGSLHRPASQLIESSSNLTSSHPTTYTPTMSYTELFESILEPEIQDAEEGEPPLT